MVLSSPDWEWITDQHGESCVASVTRYERGTTGDELVEASYYAVKRIPL